LAIEFPQYLDSLPWGVCCPYLFCAGFHGPKTKTAVVALQRLSTLKENSNYAEKRDSAFACDGFIDFRKFGACVRDGQPNADSLATNA
jgi:hypothetical protein